MSRKHILPICVTALLGALMLLQSWSAEAKPPSTVPGAEPYQTSMNGGIAPYNNGGGATSRVPIPADRRLVIEYVSVSVIVQAGQKPSLGVVGVALGAAIPYLIPLALEASTPNGDVYRGSQLVRLYVDGDGQNGPQVQCVRDVAGPSPAFCDAAVSGYLIGK